MQFSVCDYWNTLPSDVLETTLNQGHFPHVTQLKQYHTHTSIFFPLNITDQFNFKESM